MTDSSRRTLSATLTCLAVLVMAGSVWLARGCTEGSDTEPPRLGGSMLPIAADDKSDTTPLVTLARQDQTALLEKCLAEYDARPTRDFTCTFTRVEVIRGRRQPRQQAKVKFRQEPFSVAMHWVVNPPGGDRVVYVEGLYPDDDGASQMVVQPAGGVAKFFTGGSVLRLPTAKDVMAKTLRPITQFGFRDNLQRILEVCRQSEQAGGATEVFEGTADVEGRPCLVVVRTIDEPWADDIPNRTRLFIDRDLLVPIRLEGYRADGELMWEYQFDDIDMNVGLTDADFTPEANGIAAP